MNSNYENIVKATTTDLTNYDDYDAQTNTSDVELKKSKIFVNRTSRVRQTTSYWMKRILDKAI